VRKLLALFFVIMLSSLLFSSENADGREMEKLYIWQEYEKNPTIYDVAVDSTYIWGAYPEGLIRWHKQDHTYNTYPFDDEIMAIETAVNNNLWVGTQNGLYRFDGLQWTHYTTDNALPNNRITSLNRGPQDQLFVGAESDLIIFNGTQWTPIPTSAMNMGSCFGFEDGYILDIAVDSQNRLWASIGNAFTCYYEQGVWQRFFQNQSIQSSDIEFHPNGDMWLAGVGGNDSVARLTASGEWITYNLSNKRSTSLTIDSTGIVWAGFEDYYHGISKFDGETWLYVPGFQGGSVYDLESDMNGDVWSGGTRVSRLTNELWQIYLAGIPTSLRQYITAMHVAPNNDLWLGIYEVGVVRFDGEAWWYYLPPHASGILSVDAIASDHLGNMWFGLSTEDPIFGISGDGLVRFDGQDWETFTTADGLAENWITSIAVDDANDIWVGHQNSGISRKSVSGFTTYAMPAILSDYIKTIIVHDNNTWIGYWSHLPPLGLSGFNGINWTHYGDAEGLNGNVLDFAVDDNNVLLALTDSGVFFLDDDGWSDLGITETWLQNFTVDRDGNVWLVSYTGAFKFDGSQTYPITPMETGTSTLNYMVEANESGNTLWFRSNNGVVRLRIFENNFEIFLPMITK